MFFRRPMTGVRDLIRGGNVFARAANLVVRKPPSESYDLAAVLRDACAAASVPVLSEPSTQLEDYVWWKRLCNSCAQKITTNEGGRLLRLRLVNALSQRLAIDEIYRLNKTDIEKEEICSPLILMGLPRSNGHFACHVLSQSGLFLTPRQCDTLSPSLLLDTERRDAFKRSLRWFTRIHPDFLSVRVPQCDQADDDLTLHLMSPQSYAWGLLHGLDEHLLQCLDADQTPVYQQVRRTMQLLQWYKRCGHFSECVAAECEPLNNPLETQTYGPKSVVARPQWLLYSPFAILSSDAVNTVFPDMRVIWVHRALAQCIPSLCSSLCLHNALYTGKPPTETQLATMGEKVLGIFGSGTDDAISFYGNFDQRRMAHWSNRDIKRHTTRVTAKTLNYFGIEVDRYRRLQMIDAQTDYISSFRPKHDAQLPYFCLHEGVIGDVFNNYIYQFEEFAFEKKFGVTIESYEPLGTSSEQLQMGSGMIGPSEGGKRIGGSFASNQPISGHLLQEGKAF